MDKAKIGKASDEYGTKRLSDEDVAKRSNKSDALSGGERERVATGKDTPDKPKRISTSWRVTAISQTPDEILEKVFREGRNKKDIV